MQSGKSEQGSVLMEFVIVLPIYFMLIGFVFVIGELALHSIHLTGQMDRGMALSYRPEDIEAAGAKVMGADTFIGEIKKALSLDKDQAVKDYDYTGSSAGGTRQVSEIAESDHIDVVPSDLVDGHFAKAVAGNVTDNYTLTPLARGFVEFWYHEAERRVHDGDLMADTVDRLDEGAVEAILKDGMIGRTPMQGNYRRDEYGDEVRKYGYYSLQRDLASYPDAENANVPYRGWMAGALAQDDPDQSGKSYWEHMRDGDADDYGEKFPTVKLGDDEFITSANPGQRLNKGTGGGPLAHAFTFTDILCF